MFIISCAAKVVLFFRKVNNKLVSLYQLSQIPHGKNCEIRGGSSFQGNITFGDHVVIGTNSNFMSTGAKITIGNSVLFGPHVFIITGNHQVNQIGKYIIDVEKKQNAVMQMW